MISVSRIHYPVTALGPGKRLGVWFQGCSLACPGCMSRDTWDPTGGTGMTVGELAGVWEQAIADGADGLTVSGGEPFDQPSELAAFLAEAAARRGAADLDLLVYTGYEFADAVTRAPAAPELADALITGRYDVTRPTRLIWRGSGNQVLHLLTPLAQRRYAAYTDYTPDHPPIQVAADDERIWLIGVPPPGTLRQFERGLRQREITLEGPTWRP
jgi:anaerobic ribonucleoside-triphosphate reductase activating protein